MNLLIVHFLPASYVVQHQTFYNIKTIHILRSAHTHTHTHTHTHKEFHMLLIMQTAYCEGLIHNKTYENQCLTLLQLHNFLYQYILLS
jgi:hypothetical protein